MDCKELLDSLEIIEKEKGIPKETIFEAIETSLVTACKKNYGTSQNIKVDMNRETGEIKVFAQKEVVEDVYDAFLEVSLEDAQEINPMYELGDFVDFEITPKNFGRISAQTAKQVVVQKFREAEREKMYNEFSAKEKEVETAIVQRTDGKLCNPNNPTGITIPQDLLEEILETCAMQGIFMVVDECFLDFVKDPEKHTLKGKLEKYPGLFILKAFTKRYAIPGVRLGYGFCSDGEVLDRMEAVTQPWNVSTMAQQAGMAALKESEYVEAGRQIIFRESAWMKEKMRQLGLTVYPSEANYIFFYGPEELFERCVAKGILIRDCSNYPGLKKGYYRVAVKLHEQNEKLIEVLEEVLS